MDERSRRVAARFETPMLIASLLVIPLLVIEESDLGEPWTTVADILNWGTWLAFLFELIVMLAVVPSRKAWLRDHPVEVITVVLTPPILPPGLAAARLLRLLRVLRLLRLAPLARRLFTLEGLRYASLVAAVTILGAATAFASIEPRYDEWDGVWWAVGTMTTAGSGNVIPTTTGTEAIGMTLMLAGLGFGSLLIGAIAERFVAQDVAEEEVQLEITEREVLHELESIAARLDHLHAAVQSSRDRR
jgi:voltage-gated potassium channel